MKYVYQVYSPLLDMVIGTFDEEKKARLFAADETLKLADAYRNYLTNQYIGKLLEIAKEPRPLVTPQRRFELVRLHAQCNPRERELAKQLADVRDGDDDDTIRQVCSSIDCFFHTTFGACNAFEVRQIQLNVNEKSYATNGMLYPFW